MSQTPAELPLADLINEGLAALAGCVCSTIDPVCACGVIIGETFVDIAPDADDEDSEECDEGCSKVWVRVMDVYPASGLGQPTEEANAACDSMLGVQIEIGVTRCFEIPKDGEAPLVSEMLASSQQNIRDMVAIRQAILCCDHFEDVVLGDWTPSGPEGSEYGGIWTLAVLV